MVITCRRSAYASVHAVPALHGTELRQNKQPFTFVVSSIKITVVMIALLPQGAYEGAHQDADADTQQIPD